MAEVETGRIFIGARDDLKAFLATGIGHYTYVLRRPDGTAFYVGKGLRSRVLHHEAQARLTRRDMKLNTIRRIAASGDAILYEIDGVFDTHAEAIAREVDLIARIGRRRDGGPLTNLTAGGEGVVDVSPEAKERHRQSLGGVPEDDPDKAIVNRFFLRFGEPRSICIKVAAGFRIEPTVAYDDRSGRSPTRRMALALAVVAAGTGQRLTAGTRLPRLFAIEGIPVVVENGVSRDMVTAGLAAVEGGADPWHETFRLAPGWVSWALAQIEPAAVEAFKLR